MSVAPLAQTAPSTRSPEVSADGRITFRLRAPGAQQVTVRGLPARLTMQKDATGVWSATTEPLPPDIYLYTFGIDGANVTDPANTDVKTSYPSGAQSIVHVPGDALWEPRTGERGVVSLHHYHSAIVGNERPFFVYTPPGYDAARPDPYPVLYLLHGLTDDASAWMTVGAANVILDNLINEHRAVPMIVVCPLGYGTAGMLIDAPDDQGGPAMMPNFARALVEEVMPRVEQAYHARHDASGRAIAGLSMGGAEAIFTTFSHPGTFAWTGSFSGAFNMWPRSSSSTDPSTFVDDVFPQFNDTAANQLQLLYVTCGTDDFLMGMHDRVTEWLTSKHVTFVGSTTPGYGHVWPLWRRNLVDFVPRLFH